jgi:hypothetical protein
VTLIDFADHIGSTERGGEWPGNRPEGRAKNASATSLGKEPEFNPQKSNHHNINCLIRGGEGGIRTPGTLARTPHFECGAIDHSATSPGPSTTIHMSPAGRRAA